MLTWSFLNVVSSFEVFNPMQVPFVEITPKTWTQNLSRFRSEDYSQAVLFYAQNQDAKTYVKDTFAPLAKKMLQAVRMMALNCDDHASFCKDQDPAETWKKGPTVITYPPLPRPIKIMGPNASEKDIKKEVVGAIPRNNVTALKAATFDSFIDDPRSLTMPKVLLFADKASAPPSVHAVANAMNDRIAFGYINVTEEGSDKLQARILKKDTDIPKLTLYKAKKIEVFDGIISNANEVFEWVNIHAETFVKGGGFSETEAPSQPWLDELIPQMNKESHGAICFKQSALCAVYVTPQTELTTSEQEMLETVMAEVTSSNSKDAKLKFSWLSATSEKKAAAVLEVEHITAPHFLIINPNKRLRFTSPVEAKTENILSEIENLNAGNQRFKAIKGKKIPTFSSNKSHVNDEL